MNREKEKIEVGILGATGMVGQQFLARLAAHPWFRVTWLGASERSAGQRYGDLPWRLTAPLLSEVADLRVDSISSPRAPQLLFSALDATVAGEVEEAFAKAGHIVVSNARNHRMDPLVPLLVPEINAEHLALVPSQREAYGRRGFIITNPNCSTVFLALALAPLRQFGIERVIVNTLQALSGAGYPGVASLDALGNVIPHIAGEEEKLAAEAAKILGSMEQDRVVPQSIRVSAQCTRVPVEHGHTELVSVGFRQPVALEDIRMAWKEFTGEPQRECLPSAPLRPLIYREEGNRPQPRCDVEHYAGMSVQIGRLRRCEALDAKFVLLGHNLIRGAAGAAILNAELLASRGWLADREPELIAAG